MGSGSQGTPPELQPVAAQVSLALVCEEDGSFTAYTASGAAEAAIHDLQPMVGWANSPYWPYFVDWDGDGALDAVAERKNIARDGMRLFSLGHCVSPCNGGRCEADGRCSCLPDRALEDCSGCRTRQGMQGLSSRQKPRPRP